MKKWLEKTLAVILTTAMTMSIGIPAFASEEIENKTEVLTNEEQIFCNTILQDIESEISQEMVEQYSKDILFLKDEGFSQNDLVTLDTDIHQVANLIEELNMDENEIETLKNGFVTSRPIDPSTLVENSHFLTYEEVGMPNPNEIDENMVSTKAAPAYKEQHISLFTDPSKNKFFEETGHVTLGNTYATSSRGTDGKTYYTRPYVMFGAHGTTGGVDAGLVWFQEHNKWTLFMSAPDNGGWKQGQSYYNNGESMAATKGLNNGGHAYLDLKCADNYATIIWRSPSTWLIEDQQAIYMGSGYTNNSSIELVRENTLAQGYSGSYLNNVQWWDVHLYSLKKTVPAEKNFFKSSRGGFEQYNSTSNYMKRGAGVVTATGMNYSGETSNLRIN